MIDEHTGTASRHMAADEGFDLARFSRLARRHFVFTAVVVALFTAGVIVVSLTIPSSYRSTVQVRVYPLSGTPAFGQEQGLATLESLVTTTPVLRPSSDALGIAEEELRGGISTSIDQEANMLFVTVDAASTVEAEKAAIGVAESLDATVTASARTRLSNLSAAVAEQISALGDTGSIDNTTRLQVLQSRQAELDFAAAAADSQIEVVGTAESSGDPVGPTPLRNGLIAFFVSSFFASLLLLRMSRRRNTELSSRELPPAHNS